MNDPLATADQRWCEQTALRLEARPDIRAAREAARAMMLADKLSGHFESRQGLDRALDQWVMAICMREANADPARPRVTWNVDNAPRNWFGHAYPGAAVAVDNPDNMNREVPIDGASSYELDIQFAENPASMSIVVEIEPAHHAGIGEFVASLPPQVLDPQPSKHILVTVGPDEAGDRPYHIRTQPGRLQLYIRDSHADWRQKPAKIAVRRITTATAPERSEDELAAAIIAGMTPFVRFWSGFKNTFLGPPEPNILVGPQGRIGGWGFLAGGKYKLAEGQGLLVTIDRANAAYNGFQVTDLWTIAPDPVWRTPSRNKTQSQASADGTVSFIIAAADPGIVNWIDTCGLTEGWMLLRWQGVPEDADPKNFIREVRLIKLEDVPAGLPRIDLAGRRAEIVGRAALHKQRLEGGQ
jgi:hypothetical protein